MWTYTTAGGSFTKTASFDKKIPKKTFTLNIQKKDAETGAALTGAQLQNLPVAAPSGCRAIKNSPVSGMMRFTGESCFFISVLLSLPGLSALPRFP